MEARAWIDILIYVATFALLAGPPMLLAGIFFLYFYRTDRIPGLKLWQAFALLVVCRVLDGLSFLWAAQGEFMWAEVNLAYLAMITLYPHSWAFGIGFVLSNVVIFGAIWTAYLLGSGWVVEKELRWFMHAVVATASVLSLVGAATNLAVGIWGTNSPFLFP